MELEPHTIACVSLVTVRALCKVEVYAWLCKDDVELVVGVTVASVEFVNYKAVIAFVAEGFESDVDVLISGSDGKG